MTFGGPFFTGLAWQLGGDIPVAKNQQDEQGIIGREPAEEAKPAPRVPRRPVDPAPESKTVLDHRAKLAEMDRKRGF